MDENKLPDDLKRISEQYVKVIEERKIICEKVIQSLELEARKDEANIERIKINVYEIFKTLFVSLQKKTKDKKAVSKEDVQSFQEAYLTYFNQIPVSWKEKLGKAQQFNQADNILIEETKLTAAVELKELFIKITNKEAMV